MQKTIIIFLVHVSLIHTNIVRCMQHLEKECDYGRVTYGQATRADIVRRQCRLLIWRSTLSSDIVDRQPTLAISKQTF